MTGVNSAVDLPNVLCGMHETAERRGAGRANGRPLCLELPHFHQLCNVGRPLQRAAWAGTDRPNLAPLYRRARELRPVVDLLLHEPGFSGREVGVDALLQNDILLRLLPESPGILVLATGDGNGWAHGLQCFDPERNRCFLSGEGLRRV